MKVLVLGGGDSPEREVSLRSAKAVADAARKAGFIVEERDPIAGLAFLNGIDRSTVILPILHGKNGEDGVIQAELEGHNLAYLGSDSLSSTRCFDKWLTRQDLTKAGLPMPKGALVTKDSYYEHGLSKQPHVLKVARGGSSIGTMIVREASMVPAGGPEQVFELDSEAVIEELIVGTELTVPILDQEALTPIEIVPPAGLEFDYENKYNGATSEICPPASVNDELQKKAMVLAEQVHQAMRCRHLSRVDMMLNQHGEIFVLEINTIPGLTDQSLYPKSAAVAGMTMPKLVSRFVEMVKRDYGL